MKNDISAQFYCKDCDQYNLCQYYHNRKENSYICKYFHLSEDNRDTLDKIKAEIKELATYDTVDVLVDVIRIIDKYAGGEKSNE